MQDNRTYKPLPGELSQVLDTLKGHLEEAERSSKDYGCRQFNGIQEKALVYCLEHATDVARGCLMAAQAKLPDTLVILSRALFETLIWSRYVTVSKDCAQAFADGAIDELKRTARKNLAAKYARIIDKRTGQDRSAEILGSPFLKNIPRRLSIEEAAKAGGLIRVYSALYGFISMYAHGKAFGLSETTDLDRELYVSTCSALGALECINVIASDWIVHRRQTDEPTLTRLLGM